MSKNKKNELDTVNTKHIDYKNCSEEDKKELDKLEAYMSTKAISTKGPWVSLKSGVTTDNDPNYYFNLQCREDSRSGHEVRVTVSWGIKVKGSSSSTYGFPLQGEFKVHNSYSGWFQMKGNERWNGSQDYRYFEKSFTINVGGSGAGSFGVIFTQRRSDGGSSSWNDSHTGNNFNFSSSNTAPWWTSDDAHITCWGQTLKQATIIPENTGHLIANSATAWDNEQGGNLHYDLHRYINNNYSAQVKWGGSGLGVDENISGWGPGTEVKYRANVHDGNGLWANGDRWSWTYKKNTFTRATLNSNGGTMTSVAQKQWTMTVTAARNYSNGWHSICTNNFGYRIESATSGVNVYHNTTHHAGNSNNFNWEIYIGDAAPSHEYWGIWIKRSELVNKFASSNYVGDLKLRLVSWNDYESSGSHEINILCDLRAKPAYTSITYSGGTANVNGTNYYVPGYKNMTVRWDHVPQPVGGGNCTYGIYKQIGDGDWHWVANTSNNSYEVNMPSIVGNNGYDNFRFIIRSETSYGYYSDSGGPRIKTYYYNIPTVLISDCERSKTSAKFTGTITINSNIPGGECTGAHLRNNPAGTGGNVNFTPSTGGSGTKTYVVTRTGLTESETRSLHIASKDTIGTAILGDAAGWGNTDYIVQAYLPNIQLTRDKSIFNNTIEATNKIISKDEIWGRGIDGSYRVGWQRYTDEQFTFGDNGLGVYNNAGNGSVVIDRLTGQVAPNYSKCILRIRTSNASATPGRGGFYFAQQTYASCVIYFIFKAKLPVGTWLRHHSNSYGDGSKAEWITSGMGTGHWETYILKATAGLTGTFSTIGYFALYPDDNTNPVEWYLASATSYDATDLNNIVQVDTKNGVCEIGKYLDFHSNGRFTDEDYTTRLESHPWHGKNALGFSNTRTRFYNSMCLSKGHEDQYLYSQIFFEPTSNDAGRILHYEYENEGEMWIIPSDDPHADSNYDRVVLGTMSGVTPGMDPNTLNAKHAFNMRGSYRSLSHQESSHGMQVSSRKSEHYDMRKQDTEELYDYIKDMNIYNYRNIANIKDNPSKSEILGDVMLGIVAEESPMEIVNCNTSIDGNEKNIELFSYITMTMGGLKEAIKKIEKLEGIIDKQDNKILELEEKLDGIINKEQTK